jgi:RNA polymerase sigma-70 factor (ECF subfamily)
MWWKVTQILDTNGREMAPAYAHGAADPPTTPAVDPAGPALGRAVEYLVHRLPPKERACVLLKDVFDYTIDEII